MTIDFGSFTRQLTVFTILLVIVYGLFILLAPERFVPSYYWGIIPFFYLVVLLSRYVVVWMSGQRAKSFGIEYVSATIFRFMLYVGVLLVYSFMFSQEAVVFIITFFVFYFIYTLFEVSFMYRELNKTDREYQS